jgi:hypothetical protein
MRAFLGYLLVDSLQPRKKQPIASNPGNRQRLPAVQAGDIDQLDGSAAQNDALRILVPLVLDLAVNFRIDGSATTEMHRDRETKCRKEVHREAQRCGA